MTGLVETERRVEMTPLRAGFGGGGPRHQEKGWYASSGGGAGRGIGGLLFVRRSAAIELESGLQQARFCPNLWKRTP